MPGAAEAVVQLRARIAARPAEVGLHHQLGRLLQALGRLDEAAKAFEAALALQPRVGELHRNLAEVVRFAEGDPRLAAMARLAAEPLRDSDRISLGFALGKAYGDLGRHEAAFRSVQDACRLMRANIDYDEAGTLAMFERMAGLFTAEALAERAGQGEPSDAPIFILGMPRSGSTLVEQVLAAHPDVAAGGELTLFRDIAAAMLGQPERALSLDVAGLRAIGARYLQATMGLTQGRARFTDKMPANFLMVGLIHLVLPNARIIHTVRDPVDTCLSCYATLFGDGQLYSYDLGELGRHYRAYRRLMDHWRAVLPPGVMLDIVYEDVVADLEGQARRLVDHCGLPWDPACRQFQSAERPVWTASAAQVRQPLYASSRSRWRPPAEDLAPLIEGLGPAAGEVDKSRLQSAPG
ncbi:tetratricopeptide repeat-containing sulfotransferase family protein [Phenylobacterium montanum]|uniref:Sulfotransferase n=1 Tax=Phenylobacterium montanum TaxID=2823693 RepID=A0A975FZR7_9CAUL|nr:sulfotransferase [Caulobacter sp. S6]QUD88270.1 sulfotransferase [Caulobacter sp. S6]